MTEHTETPPQGDSKAPVAPAPESAPKISGQSVRYAAYDLTYLKFVGDVHDTKAAASREAKALKVKRFEIREV